MAETGNDIKKAASLLRAGELVAIPTETVYGLAANALNSDAVAKIFEAKNRPHFDPLIIHVPSFDAVSLYASEVPNEAKQLAEKFWPGPLTLVLPKRDIVPDLTSAGLDTIGIRCPDHALTRSLLQTLDFPLAAPSANPFGYVSPTTAQHVDQQLGDRIAYILDGGSCEIGIESTIVGFEESHPVIYRFGGLPLESIIDVVGPLKTRAHSTSNPRAPGQLKSHYAPGKRVILGDISILLKEVSNKVAVISFKTDYKIPNQIVLSPKGSLHEAARNLFSALRKVDELPVDIVFAELVPNEGIGRAINDRLTRAASAH
ncbi:L-threonylcarbamoyladenylate synthase [Chryseolinea sp. T2]|uniref:L-threonylcarbamoyladenylate synthase n=1 Tax=Chryseolinea sp. T2 TaxID=3129255 RepID=UPI0030770023